jgi:hypothetical protein
MDKPATVRVLACNVKPYHYGLWCSIENGPPFVNEIVSAKLSDDGTEVAFLLDSHNFKFAELFEEIELVPLEPDEYARKTYGDFTLSLPDHWAMLLGNSIRSFARRARVDKLHTILFMGLDDRCGQREFAALTELATLAKEGA